MPNDFGDVTKSIGTHCTGQNGSHKMCTGNVTQLAGALVCSRERTIYLFNSSIFQDLGLKTSELNIGLFNSDPN